MLLDGSNGSSSGDTQSPRMVRVPLCEQGPTAWEVTGRLATQAKHNWGKIGFAKTLSRFLTEGCVHLLLKHLEVWNKTLPLQVLGQPTHP